MKKIIFTLIIGICSIQQSFSNKIYVSTISETWIYEVDLDNCTAREMFKTILFTDIAMSPEGKLYGGADFSINKLDTGTGTKTTLTTSSPVIVESMEALDNTNLIYAGSKGTDKIEIYKYNISTNTHTLLGSISGYWYPGDIVWYDDALYMSSLVANSTDITNARLFKLSFDAGFTSLTSNSIVGNIGFVDGLVNKSKAGEINVLVGMGQLLRSQTSIDDEGAVQICHLYSGRNDICAGLILKGNIIGAASVRLPTQASKPVKCLGMDNASLEDLSKNIKIEINSEGIQVKSKENIKDMNLKIYSPLGQLVYDNNISESVIFKNDLPLGILIVSIQINGQTFQQKLINQ